MSNNSQWSHASKNLAKALGDLGSTVAASASSAPNSSTTAAPSTPQLHGSLLSLPPCVQISSDPTPPWNPALSTDHRWGRQCELPAGARLGNWQQAKLTAEIFLEIARQADTATKAVLCEVSSGFLAIAAPDLYRKVHLSTEAKFERYFAVHPSVSSVDEL